MKSALEQLRISSKRYTLVGMAFLAVLFWVGGYFWFRASHAPSRIDLSAAEREEDFDAAWEFVRTKDCWLPQQPVDWLAAKTFYRPKAINAGTPRQFVAVLEQLLDELYDPHTHLNMGFPDSWRLPPYDIWAEWRAKSALIIEVRHNSAAAQAGIKPGDEIIAIDGVPPREQMANRLGHCLTRPDPAAEQWALLSLLAGRHNATRQLTLRSPDGRTRECTIVEGPPPVPTSTFESRRLPNSIGYMRFGSFAEAKLVAQFDTALAALRDTRGLILDVRDNTGGDTAIALPIAARLIAQRTQFAWMARREGAGLGQRWPEFIPTRGPWTYTQPVVVLVDHWSMSMAEGFAMALGGIGRARVVGTRMTGLGAGVYDLRLPHSGIEMQISAEPVYQLNGASRSDFRPSVEVALDSHKALQSADPIFDAGMAELERMIIDANKVSP